MRAGPGDGVKQATCPSRVEKAALARLERLARSAPGVPAPARWHGRLRLPGPPRRRFLARVGVALATRSTAGIIEVLERSSAVLTSEECRRVGEALAAALLKDAMPRLDALAAALAERGDIDPAYRATVLHAQMRYLRDVRAARAALSRVRRLRSGRFDAAMPAAFATSLMLDEARIRHRLNEVEEALALVRAHRRLGPDRKERGAGHDLEALLLYPSDPAAAVASLERRFADCGRGPSAVDTLYAGLLARLGREREAERFLERRMRTVRRRAEYRPALYNLRLARDGARARRDLVRYFRAYGLEMDLAEGQAGIDGLAPPRLPPVTDADALVSVVMSAYNAAPHIALAISGICAQTWHRLELVVVDDASTDETAAIVERAAAQDGRIRLLRRLRNAGWAVARNAGVAEARGDFVAFHDSDDWWHPRHLERHIAVMRRRPELKVTTSAWIRMDECGRIAPRHDGGFLHYNPTSPLLRRAVFDEVGYMDSVRVGADSEFIWRLRRHYGRSAEVELRLPLAVGRRRDSSLTRSGVGRYDAHDFSPVRLEYWEAWSAWHRRQALTGGDLRLPAEPAATPADRRFPAPPEILP